MRRRDDWLLLAARCLLFLAKAVRRWSIQGFFNGRLGSQMTCVALSFGEILTRSAVRLLILDQEGVLARTARRPRSQAAKTWPSLPFGAGSTGVENWHVILRTLANLSVLALVV